MLTRIARSSDALHDATQGLDRFTRSREVGSRREYDSSSHRGLLRNSPVGAGLRQRNGSFSFTGSSEWEY